MQLFFPAERVRLIASTINWRLSRQRFYALVCIPLSLTLLLSKLEVQYLLEVFKLEVGDLLEVFTSFPLIDQPSTDQKSKHHLPAGRFLTRKTSTTFLTHFLTRKNINNIFNTFSLPEDKSMAGWSKERQKGKNWDKIVIDRRVS